MLNKYKDIFNKTLMGIIRWIAFPNDAYMARRDGNKIQI